MRALAGGATAAVLLFWWWIYLIEIHSPGLALAAWAFLLRRDNAGDDARTPDSAPNNART